MTIRFIANNASAKLRAVCGLLLATLIAAVQAPPAQAATCGGDPPPTIFVSRPTGGEGISPVLLTNIAEAVPTFIHEALGGRVSLMDHGSAEALAGWARDRLLMGSDTVGTSALEELGNAVGAGDWTLQIALTKLGSTRFLRLKLVDKRGAIVGNRAREARLPDNDGQVIRAVKTEAIALAQGLDCELRTTRITPVQPLLELAATPARGKTGETVTVTVRLVDLAANRIPEPNKRIVVEYTTPQGDKLSTTLTTDSSGVANDSLVLGRAHANPGTIRARFVRSDGTIKDASPVKYYVLPAQGYLNLSTDKAQLRPTGSDTIRASLLHGSGPVAGTAVNVSASGGAVGTTSAITNSAGAASVSYVAPAMSALVDVRASATLPAGAGSTEARISYVVDPGVVMSLTAGGDTLIYGASSLKVDLERAQQAVAGATVDFSLAGGGTLSAASAATDSVGRTEIGFVAPSRAGASTITASVALDGQTYTRSVTVRYNDPLDALTREIADVKEAMWLNPSDATLSRLNTLRGILLARNEGSRAESLLGDRLVSSPLTCVHQRAHDECAAGLRVKGEATLGLVKGIVRGSQVLDYLVTRVRDSLRICPYPAFASGWSSAADATLNDIVFSHRLGLTLGISQWGDDDRPSAFNFDARDETGTINRFVRGTVRVSGAGPAYSTTIDDGDMFNLWGNRFQMLLYQRAATTPTVSVSVNGTQVSGSIQLYEGDYEGTTRTATLSFSTTVTLPPAPSMSCTNRSLPTPD